MGKKYDLLIKARGETSDAQRAMKQLQRELKNTGKKFKSVGKSLTLGVTAPILAMGVIGGRELASIEKANAQTAAAIARVGKRSLVSASGVRALAGALQKKSGIDDQAIQSAENMILTLSGLDTRTAAGKQMFEDATRSAVDFAEATGTDVVQAGKLFSKSIAAAGQGLIQLPKGVKLTADEQARLERVFKRTTDAGERQRAMIDVLGKKFQGSAKLTSTEQWAVVKDQFAGIAASILQQLMPAFNKLGAWLSKWMSKFERLSPTTKKIIGVVALLAAALGPLAYVIGSVVTISSALVPIVAGLSLTMGAWIVGIVAAITALVVLYKKNETFRRIVNAVGRAVLAAAKFLGRVFVAAVHGAKKAIDAVKAVLGWIRDHARGVWVAMQLLMGPLALSIKGVKAAIDLVKIALGWIRDHAKAAMRPLEIAIGAVKYAIDKVIGALKSAIDLVKTLGRKLASSDKLGKLIFGGDVPKELMASGGVVTGPTSAIIGEAGPEAVVPLGRGVQASRDRARVMQQAGLAGGGDVYHITINANDARGGRAAADAFIRGMDARQRAYSSRIAVAR